LGSDSQGERRKFESERALRGLLEMGTVFPVVQKDYPMIFGCSYHCSGGTLEDIILSCPNDFAASAGRKIERQSRCRQ
jgi:hypothetical protein